MAQPKIDPVLFLHGAPWDVAQRAKNVLETAGVPALLSSLYLEGGDPNHHEFPPPTFLNVSLPRAALAHAALEEAWGPDWRDDLTVREIEHD